MSLIEYRYPNGFRVIYEHYVNKIPITGAYLFCDMGSVYEYDGMRGVSHFIEHMCFKGTKKIPDSNDIFGEYSKIGAYFNAVTTKRYTCYTVKCQDEYLENSLEIVSDMMMNSTFKSNEFNKEHLVIVEENNNDKNNPHIILDNEVDKILFKGSSYEFPVDEMEYHNKETLKYNDVLEFYHTYYHPSNMILSIVSHLPFDKIKKMLKSTFFLKKQKLPSPTVIPFMRYDLIRYTEIQYKLIMKEGLSNTLLSIGFRTCPHNSLDKYTLFLLAKIMGGGFSSRLMKLLREKKGLVYTAKCDTKNYENTGSFVFFTETKFSNFFARKGSHGVLPLMIGILNDMKKHGVTIEEIKNAKGNIKGGNILNLENIGVRTQYNGEELLMRSGSDDKAIIPYSMVYDKYIASIGKEDIARLIDKYFVRENMCVCVLTGNTLDANKVKMNCERFL